mmetsp:Transcript_87391/g.194293  ORF Transcript_87391/g.194293 Transcript_87391/m.194293 type:complete len:207 (+) Transcript_87391:687-1307(+)
MWPCGPSSSPRAPQRLRSPARQSLPRPRTLQAMRGRAPRRFGFATAAACPWRLAASLCPRSTCRRSKSWRHSSTWVRLAGRMVTTMTRWSWTRWACRLPRCLRRSRRSQRRRSTSGCRRRSRRRSPRPYRLQHMVSSPRSAPRLCPTGRTRGSPNPPRSSSGSRSLSGCTSRLQDRMPPRRSGSTASSTRSATRLSRPPQSWRSSA